LRVGIDAHMVGGHETGNETYVKGLVDGFKATPDGLDLVVYKVGPPWTTGSAHVRFQSLTTANPYVRLGAELAIRSMAQRLDILHMSYTAPLWATTPVVLTVHDICFVTNPEWFSERDSRVLREQVPRSIRQAAHVITDSRDARSKIIEHYRVRDDHITAIPIGAGSGAEPIDAAAAKSELEAIGVSPERPYVLTVGNLQPRKNLVRLVNAFKALVQQGRDIDLVVVGPRHYRSDDAVEAAAGVNERVHFTGYVTDRQLAAAYRCATLFVFPSLYEGFGLPALEAMAHGVPIASSDAGSLPEVCGEAAVYFDPLSVDAIAGSIDRLLQDAELRRRLVAMGASRVKEFTWARTAAMTLEVYKKVLA
jgi:glycosyltransferase involved in cell wall biosynthesis